MIKSSAYKIRPLATLACPSLIKPQCSYSFNLFTFTIFQGLGGEVLIENNVLEKGITDKTGPKSSFSAVGRL